MKILRIRISVRLLMLLILVLGGGLGWILHLARTQREAVREIQRAGGKVVYDWEWANGRATMKASKWPRWLVEVVGVDLLANVVGVFGARQPTTAGLTDDDLKAVWRLPRLEVLHLQGCHLTDAGLLPISGLTRLESVSLSGTQVTSLAPIRNLVGIKYLGLSQTPIAEAELNFLNRFPNLESLDLDDTTIGENGIDYLNNLPNLTKLGLRGTAIQDHHLKRLDKLTGLKELRIDRTAISDRSVPLLLTILSPSGTISCYYSYVSKLGITELKRRSPTIRLYSDKIP